MAKKTIQGLGATLAQAVDISPPTVLRPSPVVLVLDVSGSMLARVAAMLFGLGVLKQQLAAHPKGRAAEVFVVTFGREVKVLADFVGVGAFQPPKELVAEGPTPVARALETALDALEKRDEFYTANELLPNTPQVFLFADGLPEGETADELSRARERLLTAQRDRRLVFTACAVGDPDGCGLEFLRSLAADGRNPHPVSGDKASFAEVFTFVTLAVLRASRPGTAAAPTQRPFPD